MSSAVVSTILGVERGGKPENIPKVEECRNEVRIAVKGENLRVLSWTHRDVITKFCAFTIHEIDNVYIKHASHIDKIHYFCPGDVPLLLKLRWLTDYKIDWLEKTPNPVSHLRRRFKNTLKNNPAKIYKYHLVEYVSDAALMKASKQSFKSQESENDDKTIDDNTKIIESKTIEKSKENTNKYVTCFTGSDDNLTQNDDTLKNIFEKLFNIFNDMPGDIIGRPIEDMRVLLNPNIYVEVYRNITDDPFNSVTNLKIKKLLDELRIKGYVDIPYHKILGVASVTDIEYLRAMQTEKCGTMRALCYSMLAHGAELQRMTNMLNYRLSSNENRRHLPALTAKEWCKIALMDEVGWKSLYVFFIHAVDGISFVARNIYGNMKTMMTRLFEWRLGMSSGAEPDELMEITKDRRDVMSRIK